MQEEIPDVVRDYLVTAKHSADMMLLLINDIDNFSRLETAASDTNGSILKEMLQTWSMRATVLANAESRLARTKQRGRLRRRIYVAANRCCDATGIWSDTC